MMMVKVMMMKNDSEMGGLHYTADSFTLSQVQSAQNSSHWNSLEYTSPYRHIRIRRLCPDSSLVLVSLSVKWE